MKARRRKGKPDRGWARASHCAGAGGLWRGGALPQSRGGLREGPSFGEAGSKEEPPQEEGSGREAGSGGAASEEVESGEAGSRRRALGRRAAEEARSK